MLNRLLKLFISIFLLSGYKGAAYICSIFKRPLPGTFVVLTYHSVKPEQRPEFERHMDYLIKAGRAVSTDFKSPLNTNQHHVAVTFDDGFQSVINNALPVLQERKIPATIFVTTDYLGKKPGWIRNQDHVNAKETVLTEDQLKQLPSSLITVGSHSVTHPRLAEIDESQAAREIVDSKKVLEEILNTNITLFALPHGSYSEGIIKLSKEAGYECVFHNVPTNLFSCTGTFLVGRIDVSLRDWSIEYRLKMRGAYQWTSIAGSIKRKLIGLVRSIYRKRPDGTVMADLTSD